MSSRYSVNGQDPRNVSSIDEVAGGHLLALSNPSGLVNQLIGYL